MKKLKKLLLPSEEMRSLKGGMSFWTYPPTSPLTTTESPITVSPPAPPAPPTTHCACTCYNCLDGGAGFTVGMIWAQLQ